VVERADAVMTLAGGAGSSGVGTGGMRTKVLAAQVATAAGIPVCVADGRRREVLDSILRGEDVGTLFLAQPAAPATVSR
jgi:glutamate 5-kinase